ncbi:MAG: ankyrin repeat domain-containing protein [Stackebrandtia sp.]
MDERARRYRPTRRAVLAAAFGAVSAACAPSTDKPREKENTNPNAEPTEESTLSKTQQSRVDAELMDAVEAGDAEAAEKALANGAQVDTRDSRDRTALLLAVADDKVALAAVLVEAGADVNAVDDQSDTPWLVTGVTGSVDMMETLLPSKPDTSITNRYGGTALQPACERGHADYVREVLDQSDIDVDQVNDLGWTGMLEAIVLGDGSKPYQDIVDELIAHDADVNLADSDGVTPLVLARQHGHDRIADKLRDAGGHE